jgi:hypothetical protein
VVRLTDTVLCPAVAAVELLASRLYFWYQEAFFKTGLTLIQNSVETAEYESVVQLVNSQPTE